MPYGPLGRGFFAGIKHEELADNDIRKLAVPFFQKENLDKNKHLLECVAKLAEQKKCTTNQLALAWVMHKGAGLAVPIPGTTKVANLESNVGAVGVHLTEEEMQALEAAVPMEQVAGTRMAGPMMNSLWHFACSPPLSMPA